MKRFLNFNSFSSEITMNESMKMAKEYVIKRYAEEHKIKSSEVSDEKRNQLVNTNVMKSIAGLTDTFPGYAPLFAIFHYEQGASVPKLGELSADLKKYKTNMADLPMNPMEYAKIVKDDKNPTTGYQQLIDDLAKIENKIKLRKLYKAFTSRMRDEFKKATPYQIKKLEEISNQLDLLPDATTKLETGEVITKNAWRSFTGNMRKYDDTTHYPAFSNPAVAFAELIKDADTLIASWGDSMDDLVDKLNKIGVEAGIVYVGNGHIAVSARTANALRILAGSTTWCIQQEGQFKSTVGAGRMQLCLIDFNLPPTDELSLVGLTVSSNGKVVDSANRSNRPILTGKTLNAALIELKCPRALISAVEDKFDDECEIKSFTDTFITGGKINGNFVSKIFGAKAALLDSKSSDKAYKILGDILIKLDKGIVKEMISEYRGHGICSEFSLELFKNIFVKYCDASDIKGILEETEFARDDSKLIIKKADKFSEDYVKQAKITIDSVDAAIEYLNKIK
jgi:hypothetical protein